MPRHRFLAYLERRKDVAFVVEAPGAQERPRPIESDQRQFVLHTLTLPGSNPDTTIFGEVSRLAAGSPCQSLAATDPGRALRRKQAQGKTRHGSGVPHGSHC
ncbi:MAG: hypothetical protein Q8L84_10080 [Hyphomonas sp.]|nr:hypothetical protein [Hyphomonas sp.]